jgi:hypothetical protein
MLRVTLAADPGQKVCMPFGYEIAVPMHFGAISDPALMVDFSAPRVAMPAERKEYWLHWDDQDMRTTLMEEAAAIHYFGNPQSRNRDDERVKRGVLPEFNNERMRVARVWGDYLYSDLHGNYSTVRVRLPKIPHVEIVPVTQSGMAVPGAPIYDPYAFFRFEELLSPDADTELATMAARRPTLVAAQPQQIDLANLAPDQIAALAEALSKYSATQGRERGEQALREHREAVKNGNR